MTQLPPSQQRMHVYVCDGCGAPMTHAQRCQPGCASIEAHTIEVVPIVEVERLREAVTYALSIVRDACEDLDDDGRQATASALHTAHERLADALTGERSP